MGPARRLIRLLVTILMIRRSFAGTGFANVRLGWMGQMCVWRADARVWIVLQIRSVLL